MNDTILLCFDCGAYYKLNEAQKIFYQMCIRMHYPTKCLDCGASLIDLDDLPTLQPVTVRESDGEGESACC